MVAEAAFQAIDRSAILARILPLASSARTGPRHPRR